MKPVWKLKNVLFSLEGNGEFFSGITPVTRATMLVGFMLLNLLFSCNLLWIIGCPFVLFILFIILFVLLRFTAYHICIFKLFFNLLCVVNSCPCHPKYKQLPTPNAEKHNLRTYNEIRNHSSLSFCKLV